MLKFQFQIYKLGINPVVDPPTEVLGSLFKASQKSKGPIPVCGTLNGTEFTQTLVKYGGKWRLYINGPMMKSAGLKVGDVAVVEIEFDPRPRDVPMPRALAAALKTNRRAAEAFDKLTPSRQKEIFRYIGSLRSAEAIARNVERVLNQLREN